MPKSSADTDGSQQSRSVVCGRGMMPAICAQALSRQKVLLSIEGGYEASFIMHSNTLIIRIVFGPM